MPNSSGLHILILSNPFPGIYQPLEGVFFRDQAFALAEKGFRVGHISVNPVSLRDVVKKGIGGLGTSVFREKEVWNYIHRYIHTPKNTLQPLKKALSTGKRLAEKYMAEHGKPDLVHVHRFEAGLSATYLKKEYGIPYVITEHSSRFLAHGVPPEQMSFAEEIFRESSANIAVSHHLKVRLETLFKMPFTYIPNLTDTALFFPGQKTETPRFLSVGNLIPAKNQRLALEGFAGWMKKYKNQGELVIAGSGPELANLRNSAKLLGIERHVRFLGRISRGELAQEMRRSSCLLLTSLHETFGVVAIEALSSGIPVISTRCGGPESIFTDGDQGYFISFSAEELAKRMEDVISDSKRFSPQNLHEYAVREFSADAVVKKLTDLYMQVLNSPDAKE